MGILDSVLGSVLGGQNRPQGQPIGSGMSPMMKALMLALAAKAYHDYTNRANDWRIPADLPGLAAIPAGARRETAPSLEIRCRT